MITIGSKNKILLFDIAVEGIDKKNLEFWFRIYDENIAYSFKGELIEEGKVKVTIPPLADMINSKYLAVSKIYPASVEVIGEGKYNVITWSDEIQLEAPPHVDVKLEHVKEEIKKIMNENKKPVTEDSKIKVKMTEVKEVETKLKEDVKKEEPKPVKVDNVKQRRNNLLQDILSGSGK